jgi:tRNA 2-thiouridine synthesizing protein A
MSCCAKARPHAGRLVRLPDLRRAVPRERERPSMAETTVNLRGLKCPLPALRTRKALRAMASGDLLIVECTDPLTAIDIPTLINQTGDTLEATERTGKVLTFRIRKR